jgi:hypothetical protein
VVVALGSRHTDRLDTVELVAHREHIEPAFAHPAHIEPAFAHPEHIEPAFAHPEHIEPEFGQKSHKSRYCIQAVMQPLIANLLKNQNN